MDATYFGKFARQSQVLLHFGQVLQGYQPDRCTTAVEQRLTYRREAVPGDTLEIYTRPLEIKAKTSRFYHEMMDVCSGEVAATCEMVAVHTDSVARISVELPDSVRTAVKALVAEY